MGSYYEDEDVSRRLIGMIKRSVGKTKHEYLKELCKFRTKSADMYWSERMSREELLPYIMMSRSETFSDYAAQRLDDLIDRLLDGEYDRIDASNEAYFLLSACMFKESDKFIEVCRRIGKNHETFRSLNISWRGRVLSPHKLPEFLMKRREAEAENDGGESEFTAALIDLLAVTAANAVKTDGEHETFTPKLRELCEECPELYAPVSFFLHFISDTSEAYDKFSSYMTDPVMYPVLMWVLDGLGYNAKTGKYEQGSPTVYAGPENEKVHFLFDIDSLDIRWYRFFTEKILSDAENAAVCDPNYARAFCRRFSSLIYRITIPSDDEIMGLCRAYFGRSAVIAGNPADFAGLVKCGMINTPDELQRLALDIAERISMGKQTYCYHVMMSFFGGFDRSAKLSALNAAAEYLVWHDRSERLESRRREFFKQLELMNAGKPNVFEQPRTDTRSHHLCKA